MNRPTLIVYCGLPGVGKSAASAYTAEQLSTERYRSDQVRKRLFPDPEYTDEETVATYEELLACARSELEAGADVVLDATFRSKRFRDRAAALASEVDAAVVYVHVTCDVDVVRERLENRTETISDAEFEQHLQLKRAFEPIERDHVVIDNSGSLEETYRQIDREVL
ncbi:AAA family ATPase [Natronobeatus ordinarius]|uniref:AAA family ATPase n=1 Tax=Natronobeatus ordinarius TaxID=2963433 RepID=UPI0020CFE646|nr:AAA family ATPase [Natronobeatus ordinarius]